VLSGVLACAETPVVPGDAPLESWDGAPLSAEPVAALVVFVPAGLVESVDAGGAAAALVSVPELGSAGAEVPEDDGTEPADVPEPGAVDAGVVGAAAVPPPEPVGDELAGDDEAGPGSVGDGAG
jgi:hypothetical protein